jgi:MIP family channel proteins
VQSRGRAAYMAEFVGTFLLVLFIGIVLAVNSKVASSFTDFAVIGLLHAFVLMMLVATLGGTSGAHFNPAVTTGLAVLRKIAIADAVVYILLQLAGAVCAALVVKLLFSGSPAHAAAITHYGATGVNHKLLANDGAAFLAELIATFALVWAVVGTAVNPRADRDWAPFVIGATLGLGVMCIGPLTGAGINPARAFGPALVGHSFGGAGTFLFVYVAGPIVGGVAAALGYTSLVLAPRGLAPGLRPIDTLEEPVAKAAPPE